MSVTPGTHADVAETQTLKSGSGRTTVVSLPLTFGINVPGTNHWAELCVSGKSDAGGALLHGQSAADGLGSLCRRCAMRYGKMERQIRERMLSLSGC